MLLWFLFWVDIILVLLKILLFSLESSKQQIHTSHSLTQVGGGLDYTGLIF